MEENRVRTRGDHNFTMVEATPQTRTFYGKLWFSINESTKEYTAIGLPNSEPYLSALTEEELPAYPFVQIGPWYYPPSPAMSEDAVATFEPIIRAHISMQLYQAYVSSAWGTIPYAASSNLESMTDVVGSRFQSRKNSEFVVNPMAKSAVTFNGSVAGGGSPTYVCTFSGGSSTSSYGISYREIKWTMTITPTSFQRGLPRYFFDEIVREAAQADAASAASTFADAFAKVQAAEMEVLTSLAESGKTINHIIQRLGSLARLLRGFRKRAFEALDLKEVISGVKKHAKLTDEYWLELRYAIRPLVMDVENAMKALSKSSLEKTWTFRSRDLQDGDYQREYSATIAGIDYFVEVDFVWMETYSAGLYTRLEVDELNASRFGLYNIATTAWELVPFSFVFDWFFNVAGTVATLNPNPIYRIENGYQSTQREVQAFVTCTATPPGEDPVIDTFVLKRDSYTREKQTVPTFFTFNLDLNVFKIADLMALVSTGFKRGSSTRL